jgi:hypothetical protein
MAGMIMLAASAQAALFGFTKITNNASEDLSGQLLVDVTDAGSSGGFNLVSFRFTNDIGIASSITDVYWDDGTLLAIGTPAGSSGVSFSSPATPGNLPGANDASPPFQTTQQFSADSDSPVTENGVNSASEFLDVVFTIQAGLGFADTIAAINDGSLRMGMHVQAIGAQGESDGYVNNPQPVPAPGAAILATMGLTIVSAVRRRMA